MLEPENGDYIFVVNFQHSEFKLHRVSPSFCDASQILVQLQIVCCKEHPQKTRLRLIKITGWQNESKCARPPPPLPMFIQAKMGKCNYGTILGVFYLLIHVEIGALPVAQPFITTNPETNHHPFLTNWYNGKGLKHKAVFQTQVQAYL